MPFNFFKELNLVNYAMGLQALPGAAPARANRAMGYEPAKKIVTSFVYPPIPRRDHDWCAHYEGEEEKGGYGWGRTEQEAIDDLIDNYDLP